MAGKKCDTLTEREMEAYTAVLKEELKPALGCTEPISIAYGAAYARTLLGKMPDTCEILCSGNIIKNVKAVTVPETGGLKGIEAAVLAGALCQNAELGMEVLSAMTEEKRQKLIQLLQQNIVKTGILDTAHPLHFILTMKAGDDSVSLEIIDSHMNLGEVWKNKKRCRRLEEKIQQDSKEGEEHFSIRKIFCYACQADLEEVSELLRRQVSCNMAIAREGMKHAWGASVGPVLLQRDDDIYSRICAATAAGSDARMNGCPLPVVINSGSGNQGLTVSVPVVLYARYRNCPEELMLRALCVSNLIAIYQKRSIGKLSAFCGAVSAAAGAVCGIAFVDGCEPEILERTLVNTVASVGGMVCDGAKSSCAAKIAAALFSALLGYDMAKQGRTFLPGEGIVGGNADRTVENIGRMAACGMKGTDREILEIMLGE